MTKNGDDEHPQDPHVERLRPNPSEPPQPTRTLIGFLGDSDRTGMRRLYLSQALDYYAEFRTDDALSITTVPPETSPFPGHQVSEVILRRDATVDYTHTHTPSPGDEFDLDIQLGAPSTPAALPILTRLPGGCNTVLEACWTFPRTGLICRPTLTRFTQCDLTCTCPPTHITCTCNTQCNQNTCAQTCTCNTQCNQNTCAQTCTCNTQCNQNTCAQTCTCNACTGNTAAQTCTCNAC